MSIIASAKGTILSTVISHIAASEPKTTVAGALLGGIVATKIDYTALLQGDSTQIGTAVAALVIAALGYYSNNKKATSAQ